MRHSGTRLSLVSSSLWQMNLSLMTCPPPGHGILLALIVSVVSPMCSVDGSGIQYTIYSSWNKEGRTLSVTCTYICYIYFISVKFWHLRDITKSFYNGRLNSVIFSHNYLHHYFQWCSGWIHGDFVWWGDTGHVLVTYQETRGESRAKTCQMCPD